MPDIRNMSDLAKYISKSSQVLTDANIEKVLIQEAQRLEQYLKDEINIYYQSYVPKVYHRTYNWINSIRVSRPKTEGNTLSIKIYFDDSMAYHPSVMGENQLEGYVPWLMEVGWSISQHVQPRHDMFTDFKSQSHIVGTDYVTKAVTKYNENNPYGFKVTVETGYGNYI